MILNKGGKLIDTHFTINGPSLENVQDFCYLGFKIDVHKTAISSV